MSKSIVQRDNLVYEIYQQYEELSFTAHTDRTYQSDLAAALRAPSIFMRNPDNFEVAFDAILHHLDKAIKKANSHHDKQIIQESAQEIFFSLVHIIEQKIAYVNEKARENVFKKAYTFLTKSIAQYFTSTNMPQLFFRLAPDAVDLLADCLNDVITKWKAKEQENYFNVQLCNVYQKIISSRCFGGEYTLLRNTFSRQKEVVLPMTIANKGLTAALNLTQIDETLENGATGEKAISFRIICNTLIGYRRWDDLIGVISCAKKEMLNNCKELEHDVLQAYEIVNKPMYIKGHIEKRWPLAVIGLGVFLYLTIAEKFDPNINLLLGFVSVFIVVIVKLGIIPATVYLFKYISYVYKKGNYKNKLHRTTWVPQSQNLISMRGKKHG